MATEQLYATDAYLHTFEGVIKQIDADVGRVALNRTAFYPGGGGQPHDTGVLVWDGGEAPVTRVEREGQLVWHWLADLGDLGHADELPAVGTEVQGSLDWQRRHLLMRTHTALHVLCGVIWADYRVAVTGGNMTPGQGRLDFPLEAMSAELGAWAQRRVNEEIARAREVAVDFVARATADRDEALIRTQATLLPPGVDPLRVIDIRGLDRQADGGTHVGSTAEVGRVAVVKTESKGKANKRIRIAVGD